MSTFSIMKFAVNLMLLMWCMKNINCKESPNKNVTQTHLLINLLNDVEDAVHTAKQVAMSEIRPECKIQPMDCADIQEQNSSAKTGVYQIWPHSRISNGPISVLCDFENEGGGWTIIQRRGDFGNPKDYFYRDWDAYKKGFGDILKDFWIGNDNIFSLTNERASTIKFVLQDWEGNTTYAEYDEFWIDDEDHNYTAHVSGYRGNAGNGFGYVNGLPFTTRDRDNDLHPENCGVKFRGAWWYEKCHSSNLNGLYLKGAHETYADGVNWRTFRGNHYSLKETVIKIRPIYFGKNS